MQSGPLTELLFIPYPGMPAETMQRFARGPLRMMFLRAGNGCDVQDLGVPPDEPAILLTVQAPLLWQGFTYQLFGTYETPQSPPEAPKLQVLGPAPHGLVPLTLIAWRRRLFHQQCPLYIEARWQPSVGESLTIKGLGHDTRKSSIDTMYQAFTLLKAVEGGRRGRPYNTGYYRSSQEFHAAYRRAKAMFVSQNRRHYIDEDLWGTLGITKGTFYSLVKRFGRPPPLA